MCKLHWDLCLCLINLDFWNCVWFVWLFLGLEDVEEDIPLLAARADLEGQTFATRQILLVPGVVRFVKDGLGSGRFTPQTLLC